MDAIVFLTQALAVAPALIKIFTITKDDTAATNRVLKIAYEQADRDQVRRFEKKKLAKVKPKASR